MKDMQLLLVILKLVNVFSFLSSMIKFDFFDK